ncbi:TorD/DmsD family molecular chaperone [methane-oxidizing endosymbiont of Gigantopelta aegis]|uniref:TorD/DmsD family molecular chaperone n=1 Tax=methane-oxidizing endosymbiont of Gigantopelta aegis TaxID=2794938 RepID=UPI0018DBAC52|nr:molecular chaperone TorD family protein [methane-oxidizing endosymbiont of Gigantopelta aegis]
MNDEERLFFYQLIARLFRAAPDQALLKLISKLEVNTGYDNFSQALSTLISVAKTADIQQLDDDYHHLFIGLGRGELVPYLSWYQTGFLMEKPLASLRQQLKQLGIRRQPKNCEPEDHISAICEVMALLIQDQSEHQNVFFQNAIAPWFAHFFSDLKATTTGNFYPIVAELGLAFIALEARSLSIPYAGETDAT